METATQRFDSAEPRVFRQFALPVSAFDILKDLQRHWQTSTNAEVVTRLLHQFGPLLLKTDGAKTDASSRRTR